MGFSIISTSKDLNYKINNQKRLTKELLNLEKLYEKIYNQFQVWILFILQTTTNGETDIEAGVLFLRWYGFLKKASESFYINQIYFFILSYKKNKFIIFLINFIFMVLNFLISTWRELIRCFPLDFRINFCFGDSHTNAVEKKKWPFQRAYIYHYPMRLEEISEYKIYITIKLNLYLLCI